MYCITGELLYFNKPSCYEMLHKQQKMDMKFVTRNVRSLCRADLLETVASELGLRAGRSGF